MKSGIWAFSLWVHRPHLFTRGIKADGASNLNCDSFVGINPSNPHNMAVWELWLLSLTCRWGNGGRESYLATSPVWGSSLAGVKPRPSSCRADLLTSLCCSASQWRLITEKSEITESKEEEQSSPIRPLRDQSSNSAVYSGTSVNDVWHGACVPSVFLSI